MNKKYLITLGIILVAIIAYIVIKPTFEKEEIKDNKILVKDYKNISYIIEGQPIALVDGYSEIEADPNSASKIITRYFGNEVKHDLNNDGTEDVAFLITQESGGSGQFFYVVAALNTPTGYVGSQAFFLGDRIAPQTTNVDEGITARGSNRENVIVVNFATRKENEPMTAHPSIGKSMWIKLDPKILQFNEVVQNFEGESR